MRTKNTAQKFTAHPNNSLEDENVNEIKPEDNVNEVKVDGIVEEDVELPLECHTDNAGNQFLSDGTPIIEPTPVSEYQLESSHDSAFESQWIGEGNGGRRSNTNMSSSSSTASSVTGISVKCTACNKRFNPYMSGNLHIHPALGVIICWECADNQRGNYFVVDSADDKETLCRWCVEGGYLICCDFCPKSFCKNCIRRNLGKDYLALILKQDQDLKWQCFVCDDKPTAPLRDKCKLLSESVEEHRKRNPPSHRKRDATKTTALAVATATTTITIDTSPSPSYEGVSHQSPQQQQQQSPSQTSPPSLSLVTAPNTNLTTNVTLETRKRIAPMPPLLQAPPIKAPTLVSVVTDLVTITSGSNTLSGNSNLVPKLSLAHLPGNASLQPVSSVAAATTKHWQNGAYRTLNYDCLQQMGKIQHHGNSYYLRNNSVKTMLHEIDSLSTQNVINGIHVTKRLIESFYSDLHNLEVEISQASSSEDLELVSSTFKALYRHHLFSRLGQLGRRLTEEDIRHKPGAAATITNGDFLANNGVTVARDSSVKTNGGVSTFPSNITITNVVSNSQSKHQPPATVVDLTDDGATGNIAAAGGGGGDGEMMTEDVDPDEDEQQVGGRRVATVTDPGYTLFSLATPN